jgi:hypothetical protein
MKLVLVHGRSQQGKDPVALEKTWTDALTYGLARGDVKLADGTEFVFPYYGDELKKLVDGVDTALADGVILRGPSPDTDDATFRGELLAEMAAGLGLTDADFQRELPEEEIERAPQNWGWVRAIARAIDRIPGVNGDALELFTRDVYVYLTYEAVREKIKKIVADLIPAGETFLLLSHSLGTVVAYDVLCDRAVDPKCVRFVTVGSPLGIEAIQRRLGRELSSPVCVDNWFNAFDPRDIVALRPLDNANFAVQPPVDNYGKVVNFTDNRHGIAGYLSDPVVAQKLAQASHED